MRFTLPFGEFLSLALGSGCGTLPWLVHCAWAGPSENRIVRQRTLARIVIHHSG